MSSKEYHKQAQIRAMREGKGATLRDQDHYMLAVNDRKPGDLLNIPTTLAVKTDNYSQEYIEGMEATLSQG